MTVPHIFCIIPAFNEEANIGVLLGMLGAQQWRGRAFHVLVVDDGSTDRTAAIAAGHANTEVLRHATNLGCREAFLTGFRRALALAGDDDVVVTMEADTTSDLAVLEAMVSRVEGGADVVLASCYAPGGSVEGASPHRVILRACANWLPRACWPRPGIHTFSSFYRAFRARALRRAFLLYGDRLLEDQHFVSVVGMLLKLSLLPELRIEEVPMVLRCQERRGASKMRILRTTRGYLRFLTRERLITRRLQRLLLPASWCREATLAAREPRRPR